MLNEDRARNWAAWLDSADHGQLIAGVLAHFPELMGSQRESSVVPAGEASRSLLRMMASRLVEAGDAEEPGGRLMMALGYAFRTIDPRSNYVLASVGSAAKPTDERETHLEEAWQAVELSRRLDDPLVKAVVTLVLARAELEAAELGSRDFEKVIRACGDLDDSIENLLLGRGGSAIEILRAVGGIGDPRQIGWRLRVARHRVAASARRMLGDLDGADLERRGQLKAANETGDPRLKADALGKAAHVARRLGRMGRSQRLLERQRRLAARTRDAALEATMHRSHAARARAIENWSEDLRRNNRYLACLLVDQGLAPDDVITPDAVRDYVRVLWAAGHGRAVDLLGRVCHDIARSLLHTLPNSAPAAGAEIAKWTSAARLAWTLTESASIVAVAFQELQLQARIQTGDPAELGAGMIECSRHWRRPWGPARAVTYAVSFGVPGDRAVLDRIGELLEAAPHYVDRAPLQIARARWHLAYAESAVGVIGGIELCKALRAGIEDADAGLASLSRAGTTGHLYLRLLFDAHKVKAESMRMMRKFGVPDPAINCDEISELAIRSASLPGVALQLVMANDVGQRATVEARVMQWLVGTAQLAVRLCDPVAFDRVCEVVRRDVVGSVLSFVNRHDAKHHRAALDYLRAALGPEPHRGGGSRFARATNDVANLIGPIAQAVFSREAVSLCTCETVARDTGLDAVLSMWMIDGQTLLRHTCIRDGDTFRHELDAVAFPFDAAELGLHEHEPRLNQLIDKASDYLVSDGLRRLLGKAGRFDPVRLLVIPTNLFTVPFAGLRLDAGFVVDVCEVTTMQSLQAAESLHPPLGPVPGDRTVAVTVYERRLAGAVTEMKALPHRHSARSRRKVRKYLRRRRPDILAMGLHGYTNTEDTWLSSKLMPNGRHLTIGDVLRWSVPPLVVLSSCYTHVGDGRNGGAAGFPVALQLRGARHVVGTLPTAVPDAATGEIMARFFGHLISGVPPSSALREAQLEWIEGERESRAWSRSRWAYLVLYGLPATW